MSADFDGKYRVAEMTWEEKDVAVAEAVEPPAESLLLTDYDALGDDRVGWALTADDMDELTHAGNIGDPTVATEEKGEALVEAAVSGICGLVEELEAED